MTKLLRLFPLLFLACTGLLPAQTTVRFEPVLEGKPFALVTKSGDSGGAVPSSGNTSSGSHASSGEGAAAGAVRVEVLRWYLSDLVLLRNGKPVFTPEKRHHLLDAEEPGSLDLQLATTPGLKYDEIRFTLGVDSLTAASGAFGDDLDPTNGMYWTWRSGYINFKLEGTAPECPARKNRFQFHVGGFQGAFASQREVRLAVSPAPLVHIEVDLDRFFRLVDVGERYQIMSPTKTSAELADLLANLFTIPE